LSFLFDRLTRLRSRVLESFEWTTYYRQLYSDPDAENMKENSRALAELARLCADRKIRLLIVNIPELRELDHYPFAYATEYIENRAREANAHFLDLMPSLKAHRPESLWVSSEDPHANGKATTIIAEAIYRWILAEGVLECS
jgi:lysophospholipase L1-like esterase